MRSLLAFAFSFLAATWTAFAQNPLPSPIPAHPRLFVTDADWERLRTQVQTDPFSAKVLKKIEANAQSILVAPPAERVLEGRRLLGTSRMALERITVLAMMARITGNDAYANRAARELLAVSRFSDWHTEHYLDTAEIALAVAIGYDWLYNKLSPADRAEIQTALFEKGLNTSLDPKAPSNQWITATNNWNQVCHASMTAAAIALADLHPDLATQVIDRAVKNVPLAGNAYAPDGVFPEGPMYWGYATSFHILLVAALERFSGQAFGLDRQPGFAQTPVFLAEITSPTGVYFNFSDSRERRELNIPFFWFARHYATSQWVQSEIEQIDQRLAKYGLDPTKGEPIYRLLPFVLLWNTPAPAAPKDGGNPLQWMGRGKNPVAVHRSAANDPKASYVAIKGGSPSVSHGHMDAGSFVLEADGVRWAIDLGMEEYNRLETMGFNLWNAAQNGQRWSLFRLGPEGHGILRFNGALQNVKGEAAIVRFQGKGAEGGTVLDLSPLYSEQAAAVYRGVRLLPSRAILFQDEWTAKNAPVDVGWQFITRAQVTALPHGVELRQDGQTLRLEILEPADAQVEVKTARELQRQPYDSDNPGVSRVVVKTQTKANESGSFRILAVPGSCNPKPAVPVATKLLSWPSLVKPNNGDGRG